MTMNNPYPNVEKQMDGYPNGLSRADKDWLENMVKSLLVAQGPLPLWHIHDGMKRDPDSPLKGAVMLDYTFAAVERACRAVADTKWHLKENV